MPITQQQIDEAIAKVDFGTPAVHKRGRNPRFPYVPVIMRNDPNVPGLQHQEQIKGLAYLTHDEAKWVAFHTITTRRHALVEKLADPRYRALREQYGLPREI